MKLEHFLSSFARATPDREALRCEGRSLTFGEFDHQSTLLALYLQQNGISVGDRVLIFMHNRIEFPVAFMAIVKVGAVAVTPNPRLSSTEMEYIILDAKPKAVIFEEETQEVLKKVPLQHVKLVCVDKELSDIYDEYSMMDVAALKELPCGFDDCLISYTSGTTGKPKGAVLTQSNFIVSNGFANSQQWGITTTDRILTTTPLAHRTAFSRMMNTICLGISIVFVRKFDPEDTANLIEKEGITLLTMVPTVARMLLPLIEAEPKRFSNLKIATATGEAFPVEVKRRLRDALPALRLYSYFAMTELGPITSLGPLEQFEKPTSVGRINPGVEVRLLDDHGRVVDLGGTGEIRVRTGLPGQYMTMREYFNNKEATDEALENGWFKTGDIGRFDMDGYLYIVDRKKDMVLSGGYNIYSKEVEEVIRQLSGVSDVAVIGVPDAIYGESVAAFIELTSGHTMNREQVIGHCKDCIASYKKPKHVYFISSLPRNSSGKVMKNVLREKFQVESAHDIDANVS